MATRKALAPNWARVAQSRVEQTEALRLRIREPFGTQRSPGRRESRVISGKGSQHRVTGDDWEHAPVI